MKQNRSHFVRRSLTAQLPLKCQLDDYGIRYTPVSEFVSPRQVNFSGEDCASLNQELVKELPSLPWIQAQEEYLESLSTLDKALVSFYTFHGDVILNNFTRHQWGISEDDMDYLRGNYEGVFAEVFQRLMNILQLTDEDSVEYVLMEISNRLNQIIMGSPINTQRFVTYRGSQTKDYFESSRKVFQNVGFFSTTLMVRIAKSFSKGKYLTRIIVPKGYHCLYLESVTQMEGEYEILMPDQSQYFITSGFISEKFDPTYQRSPLPTNELVMIKTKPNPLDSYLLSTHRRIKDLILDSGVRQQIMKLSDKVMRLYIGEDVDVYYQYPKIWLRRLADHQIYTLDDFMTRGKQLQPTPAEVDPEVTNWE